jgi:hypothetical protein
MLGLMQDRPRVLPHVFHRAERFLGAKRLVTVIAQGEPTTSSSPDPR